jgi:hypothetical protein
MYGFLATDIGRLLRVFSEANPASSLKSNKEIAVAIGISSKKTETVLQCAREMGLVTSRPYSVTPLGNLTLESDPYFTQPATLWLLHYLLASNASLVVWSRVFDIPQSAKGPVFNSTDLSVEYAQQYHGLWAKYGDLTRRIRGDAFSLLKLYSEEMFAGLKLVEHVSFRGFKMSRSPIPVSALSLLSAMLIYRDRYYPGASALRVSQLVDLHYSPGRLLSMDEPTIRRLLDELHAKRLVTIETRADLDQVRLSEEITWLDAYRMQVEGGA